MRAYSKSVAKSVMAKSVAPTRQVRNLTMRKKQNTKKKKKMEDPLLHETFFKKYKTLKKLGEGSFGKVYKAEYSGKFYAIKFENRNIKKKLLQMEGIMLAHLAGENIPLYKDYGYSGDWNLLIMQLLGKSLENYLRIKSKFSVKTTAMLGYQMVKILNFIHDRHIIHRDVKPDNFAMGINEYNALLYIIDFGLAKKYRSSRTLIQNPMLTNKKLTGTARYASINALEGIEQSRRDDLESVGYVLVYLMKGCLPWQGLKVKSVGNKYQNILDMKKRISTSELCKGFPIEFREFLDYTKSLQYLDEPDYEKLKNKMISVCRRMKYTFDNIYDWTTKEDIKNRKNKNYLPAFKKNEDNRDSKSKKKVRTKKDKDGSDNERTNNDTKNKKKSKSKGKKNNYKTKTNKTKKKGDSDDEDEKINNDELNNSNREEFDSDNDDDENGSINQGIDELKNMVAIKNSVDTSLDENKKDQEKINKNKRISENMKKLFGEQKIKTILEEDDYDDIKETAVCDTQKKNENKENGIKNGKNENKTEKIEKKIEKNENKIEKKENIIKKNEKIESMNEINDDDNSKKKDDCTNQNGVVKNLNNENKEEKNESSDNENDDNKKGNSSIHAEIDENEKIPKTLDDDKVTTGCCIII